MVSFSWYSISEDLITLYSFISIKVCGLYILKMCPLYCIGDDDYQAAYLKNKYIVGQYFKERNMFV